MHGAEPAVWSIYCAVFTKGFFPPSCFFKFLFYTLYPHWFPYCSQCLARFKQKTKKSFFSFCLGVVNMAGSSPRFCWADFHDVPVLSLDPWRHALVQIQAQGRDVCLLSASVGQFPQSSSIHILFLRQVTTIWGWRLSQKTLLLLNYLSTIFFSFLNNWCCFCMILASGWCQVALYYFCFL